jgi:uncharacterized protein DUF938
MPPTDPRRYAPATTRNRDVILAVLAAELPPAGPVLELASGSGEHAVYFAARLPGLTWQPSDPDAESLDSIAAHRAAAGLRNLAPPLLLDVHDPIWPLAQAAAVVAINLIHIAPWSACLALLTGAARILPPGAPLVLYGAYRRGGRPTSASNEAFDQSLRARNPTWGVRDLEEVERAATGAGWSAMKVVEMPSNNLSLIFRRQATVGDAG